MQINHAPNTSKDRVWVSLEPGRQERSIMTVRGRTTEQGKPRNSVRVCLRYTFPCLSLTLPLKLFLFLSHYFFFNFIFLLSFTFLFKSPDQQWKPRQLTSEERKDNIKLSEGRTLTSPIHTPFTKTDHHPRHKLHPWIPGHRWKGIFFFIGKSVPWTQCHRSIWQQSQ